FPCGVIARSARDSSTGVGTGSAEVQPVDWSSVPRPTRDGSKDEGLVQGHLPVVDVAFRQAEPLLQVDRREDLPVEDQALQAGYVLLENGCRAVGEFLALRAPLAAPQRKRSVLHEDRHHVLPRRGEIWIDDG